MAPAGLVLMLVSFVMMKFVPVLLSPQLVFAAVVVMAIGNSLVTPALALTPISAVVGPRDQGRVQGSSQALQSLGPYCGPGLRRIALRKRRPWRALLRGRLPACARGRGAGHVHPRPECRARSGAQTGCRREVAVSKAKSPGLGRAISLSASRSKLFDEAIHAGKPPRPAVALTRNVSTTR